MSKLISNDKSSLTNIHLSSNMILKDKEMFGIRISKEPEVRKREMIDTAMLIFSQKGYEATTMSDIAKKMNVVTGLCYRYFSSKYELYQEALTIYANECAAPIIMILQQDVDSIEKCFELLGRNFMNTDGSEKYHSFFHKCENRSFHDQLDHKMIDNILPYLENVLKKLSKKVNIHVENYNMTAKFILYGQIPIINDDSLSAEVKINNIITIINKILL